MFKETTICRLCLEPVSNFICTDCLHSDVKKWLNLMHKEELYPKILAKHSSIKSILSSDTNETFCVKCKNNIREIACPCCYLYEMYLIFKSFNQELADDFERNFNFDFKFHHGYSQLTLLQSLHDKPISSRTFSPILITESKSSHDENLCDNCGEMSGNLSDFNRMSVCESCKDDYSINLFRPFSIDFQ